MADPLAIYAAVLSTLGAAVTVRREIFVNRARLATTCGVRFHRRRDDSGEITETWALIAVHNAGEKPITVEQVGFEFVDHWQEGSALHINAFMTRAEIPLSA